MDTIKNSVSHSAEALLFVSGGGGGGGVVCRAVMGGIKLDLSQALRF